MSLKDFGCLAAAGVALLSIAAPAAAEKNGGILRSYTWDNPPSASIHEEATISTVFPFMAVFNNLVMFDQTRPDSSLDTIVPDLAKSWAWDGSKTKLTFKLNEGITWHDGKPFSAEDVKCTFELLAGIKTADDFRKNPRRIWYHNVKAVTTNGPAEVTFELAAPQPSLVALLASGYSPVYPCHVSLRDMRSKPIGTGPFKFVEWKRGEIIRLAKNPNYWKPGKPYLDGVEYKIIDNRSTRMLAFMSGEIDQTFVSDVTVSSLKDINAKVPAARCQFVASNNTINMIVNSSAPPFDNPKIRRAMALALDRNAFNQILTEGKAAIGSVMLPRPEGLWAMPDDDLVKLPGYAPDVEKSIAEGKKIMEELGYSAEKPLKVKVATRNIPLYRDPAVIFIDQMKKIHIEAELEPIDTNVWYGKIQRKDYSIGLNTTGNGVDDPDAALVENYTCKSDRNYTGYCNEEVDKLIFAQSRETDPKKRKELVWKADQLIANEVARPIILHNRAATCWQPYVKGITSHNNALYNSWRLENGWLDK
ncbi:MAG: ABC transporter substrate-binding protein [Proteobacteria bacterium]|nr:ABC transporter substrate-binding protein [Pseudomonadota bacterium]